jgi:hypothetical protein
MSAESCASYPSQDALVGEQLAVTFERLTFASQTIRNSRFPDCACPATLVEQERRIVLRAELTVRQGLALPILHIRERFELTPSEDRVLWTLLAHELCPRARELLRGLASETVADPTTDVLRHLIYGAATTTDVWRELGPTGTLRHYGLIERADGGADLAEHRQTWKVARRVLALAYGCLGLDPDLSGLTTLELPDLALQELEVPDAAVARIRQGFDGGRFMIVHGRVGSGRRSVLSAVARERGVSLLLVHGRSLAHDRDVARGQLRAVAREARLLGTIPVIGDLDALAASGDRPDRIDLLEQLGGLVLATSLHPIARRWAVAPWLVELPALEGTARARLWCRALPAATTGDAEILATTYPLAPAIIRCAAAAAITASGGDELRPSHIAEGVRSVLDHRLAGLASRVTTNQSWEDLVLPDDQATALTELLSRIGHRRRVFEEWGFAAKIGRGLGVTALFSGPPGTGKTMAAALIARAVGAELYQVDLSKITSRWVGETEKNLAALFDAAEAGNAALLFDEADSLFSKRTEVRTSNDRHANQEINFLLQRLESYAGICILTTNHESSIDEAFRRRLSIHVRFPVPEADERARLWEAMLPSTCPRQGDLGLAALASKYVMTGGYIRNAVVRAAFLAAEDEGVLDARLLAHAAQLEYEGLGKVVRAG